MAREIGNWAAGPDAKRPPPSRAAADKQEARIARALEPGETIVKRIPLGGLAIDSFNVGFWFAFAGISLLVLPLIYIGNAADRWITGPVALVWTALVVWGVWNSFTLPSRQAAVLTDRRVLLVSFGQAISARRADQVPPPQVSGPQLTGPQGWKLPDLGIQKLLVRGAPNRGRICLGHLVIKRRRRSTTYPPFTLFGVDRPLDVAAQIKQTLKLDLPIEDRTQ